MAKEGLDGLSWLPVCRNFVPVQLLQLIFVENCKIVNGYLWNNSTLVGVLMVTMVNNVMYRIVSNYISSTTTIEKRFNRNLL